MMIDLTELNVMFDLDSKNSIDDSISSFVRYKNSLILSTQKIQI